MVQGSFHRLSAGSEGSNPFPALSDRYYEKDAPSVNGKTYHHLAEHLEEEYVIHRREYLLIFHLIQYSIYAIIGIMKTTINIPDNMLQELMNNTEARTKREAVIAAISEYNRRKSMAQLTDMLGTFVNFMDKDDLDKMREND